MTLLQFNNYIKRPKLAELITIWRHPMPPTLHYFWKGALSINFVSTVQVKAQPGCYIRCLALLQLWHFVNLFEGQPVFFWGGGLWSCYDPVKYSPRSSHISNIHFNNIFWLRISTPKISPFGYSDQKFVHVFIPAILITSCSFILPNLIDFSTSVKIN